MTMKVGYQTYADDGSAWVSVRSQLSGEIEALGVLNVIEGPMERVEGSGATSTVDIAIQNAAGAAGDYLDTVEIYNGSGSSITLAVVKDGSVGLDALNPGTIAAGGRATITVRSRSKTGGWKLNITCGGTMGNIKWLARGLFS